PRWRCGDERDTDVRRDPLRSRHAARDFPHERAAPRYYESHDGGPVAGSSGDANPVTDGGKLLARARDVPAATCEDCGELFSSTGHDVASTMLGHHSCGQNGIDITDARRLDGETV